MASWKSNPWYKMAGGLSVTPDVQDFSLSQTGFQNKNQFAQARTGFQSELKSVGEKYGLSGLRGQMYQSMAARGQGEAGFSSGRSEREIAQNQGEDASTSINSWVNMVAQGRDLGNQNIQESTETNKGFAYQNYQNKVTEVSNYFNNLISQAVTNGADSLANDYRKAMQTQLDKLYSTWQNQTFDPNWTGYKEQSTDKTNSDDVGGDLGGGDAQEFMRRFGNPGSPSYNTALKKAQDYIASMNSNYQRNGVGVTLSLSDGMKWVLSGGSA